MQWAIEHGAPWGSQPAPGTCCTLRDKLSPQLFAFAHTHGCRCDCEVTDCRIVLWDDDGQYLPAEPDMVSTEAGYTPSDDRSGAQARNNLCTLYTCHCRMRGKLYKLPSRAPAPGVEYRFPRLRTQTRAVFDIVICHLNAALAAATHNKVFKKQVFDASKESHRLQCLAAVRDYIFADMANGTSKYSHNAHTLVNARKLLAEYQQDQLPWFPELHCCGQGNNNSSWLACPELQDLCQSEQDSKRAAAVHQLKWVVDIEPMHLKHLDILTANYFNSEALAGGTALTPEMVAIATQYALLGRLCEVVDGAPGRPSYEYLGDGMVRASHLAKQRIPVPHTYPILFPWPLVQCGLTTVRDSFRGEIAEQHMDSLTGIGGRMNKCIKVLHAQYLPGWNAHFDKGLSNHKLRAMACAWLYAQSPPGTKFVGFIQRVLGHTSTGASLYYELVEHKKGQPFLVAAAEDDAQTARSGADVVLIGEGRAVLHSRKHKAADPALKGRIQQTLR